MMELPISPPGMSALAAGSPLQWQAAYHRLAASALAQGMALQADGTAVMMQPAASASLLSCTSATAEANAARDIDLMRTEAAPELMAQMGHFWLPQNRQHQMHLLPLMKTNDRHCLLEQLR